MYYEDSIRTHWHGPRKYVVKRGKTPVNVTITEW